VKHRVKCYLHNMGKDDSVSGEKYASKEQNTVLVFSDLSS
jgi:hypothetical protein